MNAAETIQKAIEKLEGLRNACRYQEVNAPRYQEVNARRYQEVLHRTVDAQLAILRRTRSLVQVNNGDVTVLDDFGLEPVLALTEAILEDDQ